MTQDRSCARARHHAAGITLVEVMVALAVAVIALLGLFAAILSAGGLLDTAREREIAATAALERIDTLRELPFDELLATCGPGSDQAFFAVAGLVPPDGRPAVGRVIFLREQSSGSGVDRQGMDTYFGSAIDLNGDGDTGDGPLANHRLLGVVIEMVFQPRYIPGQVRTVFPAILDARDGEAP